MGNIGKPLATDRDNNVIDFACNLIGSLYFATSAESVVFREDDEGGRARVTTHDERVLRGRLMEMRL